MGAPLGNQNAAKAKRWAAAIERAIERIGQVQPAEKDDFRTPFMKGIDELADKFVATAMVEGVTGYKEIGDRLDGKAAQQIMVGGDPDGVPVAHKIEQVIVDPNDGTSR